MRFGGDKGSRTPDLLNAIQALYQLSYAPAKKLTLDAQALIFNLVEIRGFEPLAYALRTHRSTN